MPRRWRGHDDHEYELKFPILLDYGTIKQETTYISFLSSTPHRMGETIRLKELNDLILKLIAALRTLGCGGAIMVFFTLISMIMQKEYNPPFQSWGKVGEATTISLPRVPQGYQQPL